MTRKEFNEALDRIRIGKATPADRKGVQERIEGRAKTFWIGAVVWAALVVISPISWLYLLPAYVAMFLWAIIPMRRSTKAYKQGTAALQKNIEQMTGGGW
jgi:hypothetical protein